MTPVVFRILAVFGCCLLAGCTAAPRNVTTYKPPETPQGIVLVLNGAGGATGASDEIAAAVKRSQLPLFVRSFDWSHGPRRTIADVVDIEHAQDEASRFADLVNSYRQRFPNTPIYVVGHSAGSYVALEAAKSMPPDSLDRMVLLAPAVAANYDLRPALLAARHVDVFSSERDGIFLGIGTTLLGTADGERGVPAAGRVGFDPPELSAAEAGLATRLHQHRWDSSLVWTGHNGGHDGALRPKYLRAYVLPLLSDSGFANR